MNKKIIFSTFIISLIITNLLFTFQFEKENISTSQMINISQANAEWPWTVAYIPCEYQSSFYEYPLEGCEMYFMATRACGFGFGGPCTKGVEAGVHHCDGRFDTISRDLQPATCL